MSTQTYLNNANLKAAGVVQAFTADQVQEYQTCAQSAEYFIEQYVKIIHVDRGLIAFRMYDFQKEIIRAYQDHRKIVVKLPRQSGKSVITAAFLVWYMVFHANKVAAILANKASTAREILSRVKLAYEHLPLWLQVGVTEWNKGSIELENGSRILAGSTSSTAIRGYSLSLCFLDEYAFVPNNIAEEFFTSIYPTISSGIESKILMASTPNGMNHFFKLWTDAKESRNGFVPLEYAWDAVPNRSDQWANEQHAVLGDVKFNQEVLCQFLGSSNTLISGKKLSTLAFTTPLDVREGVRYYVAPSDGHTYVLICDPSRGLGQDRTAIGVVDVTQIPYILVATYQNAEISPLILPSLIARLATEYHQAFVLVEVNDNGQQIVDFLHYDLEYEHLIKTETSRDIRGAQKLSSGFRKSRMSFGLKTTEVVKRIGCSNLKTLLEHDKLVITDFETIQELSTFTQQGSSYRADEGYHDDLAMVLVLFAWLTAQKSFRENAAQNIRSALEAEQHFLEDQDVPPIGGIDTGLNDPSAELVGQDLWEIVRDGRPYSETTL